MENNLPAKNDNNEISRIKNWLTLKIQDALTWIDTEDGQILSNAIKSLGSFVIGDATGVILPYIFDLSNSTLRRRFLPDFKNLTDRLSENQNKIDESFLKSDVGQEILKETIRELIHQKDQEKRELHKQFLINAYTKKDETQERISTFMNILISLEPVQLRILGAISNHEETIKRIFDSFDQSKPTIPLALKNDVRRLLAVDNEIFERSIAKLESEKLIDRQQGLEILWCTGEYDRKYEKEARERMIQSLQRLITAFGKSFVSSYG